MQSEVHATIVLAWSSSQKNKVAYRRLRAPGAITSTGNIAALCAVSTDKGRSGFHDWTAVNCRVNILWSAARGNKKGKVYSLRHIHWIFLIFWSNECGEANILCPFHSPMRLIVCRVLTRQLTAVQSWKPDQPLSVETAGTAAMLPVEVMAPGALSLRQLLFESFRGIFLSAIFAPADSFRKN